MITMTFKKKVRVKKPQCHEAWRNWIRAEPDLYVTLHTQWASMAVSQEIMLKKGEVRLSPAHPPESKSRRTCRL